VIELRQPSTILLGQGALDRAGEMVVRLGGRRAFLVTTPGTLGRPVYPRLCHGLDRAGVEASTWGGTPAEPEAHDLAEAVARARTAAPDVVVGLGGGSALDLAKLTAMLLVNDGDATAYYGTGRVPRRGLPTVMIPTTAGSGSEVSQDAVLTDRGAGTKRGTKDWKLVPDCAIVDPEATWSCPPALTAASGLDALCHAVEALANPRADAHCDLYALEAIRLIVAHLPAAVERGDDVEAREGMARGALLAGLAFSPVGTGGVHACGYPLSGLWGLSHGLANGIMLPHVVAFNAPACPKYRLLAPLLGPDVAGALAEVVGRTGIPTRLRETGVERASIPRMAEIAAGDERHLSANPRPLTRRDLELIFERAW
jgi:alcohol dehydrogenase class IV